MQILVLNSGSSSIKYELFSRHDWSVVAAGLVENIGGATTRLIHSSYTGGREERRELSLPGADHRAGFAAVQQALQQGRGKELAAIGHRVVHGGSLFSEPVRIDAAVIAAIKSLIPLAPLHNPANLLGIEIAAECCPEVPQVAVFDTAFHQTMPDHASCYAIPLELREKYAVRRYGFHGTSHSFVSRSAAEYLGIPLQQCNCIVLHLGNGASACAVQGGRSVDTSMGMTPLEGLVMGTRCGDLDPAIIFYLERTAGLAGKRIDELLNRESGLRGLCGTHDMRELLTLRDAGNSAAKLAFSLYCHRVKKYIGAYLAVLGWIDALIFTGGIGENAAAVREESCHGLGGLGIRLDPQKNSVRCKKITEIQEDGAPLKILVVPTDEEREIAMQTMAVLVAAD